MHELRSVHLTVLKEMDSLTREISTMAKPLVGDHERILSRNDILLFQKRGFRLEGGQQNSQAKWMHVDVDNAKFTTF